MSSISIQKKTKVVVTLGPSSMEENIVARIVRAGADALRINMNHGDYGEHELKIKYFRKYAKNAPIIVDLSGLSIRTRVKRELKVKPGGRLIIGKDLKFNFPIEESLQEGNTILIEDGSVKLEVVAFEGPFPVAEVVYGEVIRNNKNVNVPGVEIEAPRPTEKDKQDMEWGVKLNADIFAVSFVFNEKDVEAYREYLEELGSDAWIFPKIETEAAVRNIKKILRVSDGIIVARGDLALEIPLEKLPAVQKEIVKVANSYGKPAVVATQFLASMLEKPFPTRAEISDIANAVFDGASALMLTNETAIGKYPVEAVEILNRIIREADKHVRFYEEMEERTSGDAVAYAAIKIVQELNAEYLIAPTRTGRTPRRLSRFCGTPTIIAVAENEAVARRCNILRGVTSITAKNPFSEEILERMTEKLKEQGYEGYVVCINLNSKRERHVLRVVRV